MYRHVKLQWYCQNIESLSGYSDEARVMVKGLEDLQVDVVVVGSPRKKNTCRFRQLSTIDPLHPIVYHTYRHNNYQLKPGMYSMVRTMLEVSQIPLCWVHHFNQMDEVWVPNTFNRQIFARSGVDKNRIFVIPSPMELTNPASIPPFRLESKKPFKFLTLFDYKVRERKGLDILLKAYCNTFSSQDGVCLIVKSKTSLKELEHEYSLPDPHAEIEVINKIFSREELLGVYRACDCFLLPSRGEGIGRTIMDAMMMNVPVITTNWGGQTDYLDEHNALLIDYQLQHVQEKHYLKFPGYYGAKWSEPSLEHLQRILKRVVTDKQLRERLSKQAQGDIQKFSKISVCGKILDRCRYPLPTAEKNIRPGTIWNHLFPVYFPRIETLDQVQKRHKLDQARTLYHIALLGRAPALKRALQVLTKQADIGITIIRNPFDNTGSKLPGHYSILPLESMVGKVDTVILADNIQHISQLYQYVLNTMDTHPVYVFS